LITTKPWAVNGGKSWYKYRFLKNQDIATLTSANFTGWLSNQAHMTGWGEIDDTCSGQKNKELCKTHLKAENPLMGVDQGELKVFDTDSLWRAQYLQEAERVLEKVGKWNAIYQTECGKSPTEVISAAQEECRNHRGRTEFKHAHAYKPLMCTVDFHVEETIAKWTHNVLWFIDLFDMKNLGLQLLKVFHEESAEVAQTVHTSYQVGKKVFTAATDGEKKSKDQQPVMDPAICVGCKRTTAFGLALTGNGCLHQNGRDAPKL